MDSNHNRFIILALLDIVGRLMDNKGLVLLNALDLSDNSAPQASAPELDKDFPHFIVLGDGLGTDAKILVASPASGLVIPVEKLKLTEFLDPSHLQSRRERRGTPDQSAWKSELHPHVANASHRTTIASSELRTSYKRHSVMRRSQGRWLVWNFVFMNALWPFFRHIHHQAKVDMDFQQNFGVIQ